MGKLRDPSRSPSPGDESPHDSAAKSLPDLQESLAAAIEEAERESDRSFTDGMEETQREFDKPFTDRIEEVVRDLDLPSGWPVETWSGNAHVIASGSVVSFRGAPVMVTFGPPEERLRLSLEFKESADAKELTVERILEGDHLRLVLTNFSQPLGAGSRQPLEVGKLRGRPLFLHFRIYDLRESDKTVMYTLYLVPTGAEQAEALRGGRRG